MYNIIIYFAIYSFIGWVFETIYCFAIDKKFTYRGFLYGPDCPIYGFGALIVIICLERFKGNILLVFILGLLLASILEYITSYVLEKIFNMKWWDYSDHKCNINGRVCLLNSTLFGILAVLLIELVNPIIVDLVSNVPILLQERIGKLIFNIYVVDTILTTASLLHLKDKIKNIRNIGKELKILNITIDNFSVEEIEKLRRKFDDNKEVNEILNKIYNLKNASIKYKRVLNAFPHARHNTEHKHFNNLRDLLKSNKK